MGLINDDPQLAALTLSALQLGMRRPSAMRGRMREVLDDLVQRDRALTARPDSSLDG